MVDKAGGDSISTVKKHEMKALQAKSEQETASSLPTSHTQAALPEDQRYLYPPHGIVPEVIEECLYHPYPVIVSEVSGPRIVLDENGQEGTQISKCTIPRSSRQLPLVARYSPDGRFIAIGYANGDVIIREGCTLDILFIFAADSGGIVDVSWSHNSRRLLTASSGRRLRLYTLQEDSKPRLDQEVATNAEILSVSLHPWISHLALVCFFTAEPILLSLAAGGQRSATLSAVHPFVNIVAKFLDDGAIIAGGTGGAVAQYSVEQNRPGVQVQWNTLTATGGVIKGLDTTSGRLLLTCSDSKILVFTLEGIAQSGTPTLCLSAQVGAGLASREALNAEDDEIVAKVDLDGSRTTRLEPISRALWSSDGKWVLGAGSGGSHHKIFLWDGADGKLVNVLPSPRGEVSAMNICIHPQKEYPGRILSIARRQRAVYVWTSFQPAFWQPLGPKFEQLEDNEEYVEREDEFENNQDAKPYEEDKNKTPKNDKEIDVLSSQAEPEAPLTRDSEPEAPLTRDSFGVSPDHADTLPSLLRLNFIDVAENNETKRSSIEYALKENGILIGVKEVLHNSIRVKTGKRKVLEKAERTASKRARLV